MRAEGCQGAGRRTHHCRSLGELAHTQFREDEKTLRLRSSYAMRRKFEKKWHAITRTFLTRQKKEIFTTTLPCNQLACHCSRICDTCADIFRADSAGGVFVATAAHASRRSSDARAKLYAGESTLPGVFAAAFTWCIAVRIASRTRHVTKSQFVTPMRRKNIYAVPEFSE